jgi:hypothetical protein
MPLVSGMAAGKQLPRQQSVSVVHAQSPSMHRLLSATVQPSLNGSAHVLPASPRVPPNPPPSPPPEPLQLPPQQSLLSAHAWSTATQQGVLTRVSHTAPLLPTFVVVLPVPVVLLEQGSPVAARERRASARQETRRFIAANRSARCASRTRKADD